MFEFRFHDNAILCSNFSYSGYMSVGRLTARGLLRRCMRNMRILQRECKSERQLLRILLPYRTIRMLVSHLTLNDSTDLKQLWSEL